MEITRSKVAALAIGLGYLAYGAYADLEPIHGIRMMIPVVIAQFLIWFPGELGSLTGMLGGLQAGRVDQPSAGCAVALLGWVTLVVGVPVYFWITGLEV